MEHFEHSKITKPIHISNLERSPSLGNNSIQINNSTSMLSPASISNQYPKSSTVSAKLELMRLFGLSLGDVINLNRLAMQAAENTTTSNEMLANVGAAVLTRNGNMYQGSNMESQSPYGASLTAEDGAIFKALSEGQKEIKAIAVHVKHVVKEEASQQQQMLPPPTTSTLLNTPSNSNNNGGAPSSLISPRLNQSMQQQDMPELQRGSSTVTLTSPNHIDNNNTRKQQFVNKGAAAQTKYRAVFQMPNGNWRNTLLLNRCQHFLLISCKSENNFIVKTTSSLLPQVVIPPAPSQQDIQRLNFPSVTDDFRQILDSAVYWTHIDCNEETKKQVESLLVQDNFKSLIARFSSRLTFAEPGYIQGKLGGGFSRLNFVTIQLLGHGLGEYLCDNFDRNDLANLGVVIGYDHRSESQGLSQMVAATLKAYGIRVYCFDRQAITPLVSYFAYKFKCIIGIMVTGRDLGQKQSGVMIVNNKGQMISKEVSQGIEKAMNDYIKTQYYIVDMSPLFDYSAKKVKFKPDNFTDLSMKSYIQDMETNYLLNQRRLNKQCQRVLFTSLSDGPSSDYLKKLFANFGFPNHTAVPDCSSPLPPSVSLGNACLRSLMSQADEYYQSTSFLLALDPMGESLVAAEKVNNHWHIFSPQQLAIVMIDSLIAHRETVSGITGEKWLVECTGDDSQIIEKYMDKRRKGNPEGEQEGKVIMRVDCERQAFAFGLNGTFDSLNAAIIVTQILAQAQNDNKQLMTVYQEITANLNMPATSQSSCLLSLYQQDGESWVKTIFPKLRDLPVVKKIDTSNKIEIENEKYTLQLKALNKTLCHVKLISKEEEALKSHKLALSLIKQAFSSQLVIPEQTDQFPPGNLTPKSLALQQVQQPPLIMKL